MKSKCLLFSKPQCAANGRIGLTLFLPPFPAVWRHWDDNDATRKWDEGKQSIPASQKREGDISNVADQAPLYANAVVAACNQGLEVSSSVPYKAIDSKALYKVPLHSRVPLNSSRPTENLIRSQSFS